MENQFNTNHGQPLVPISWIDDNCTNSASDCTKSTEAIQENGRVCVVRDSSGKFMPGHAGGPGRLPVKRISDAYRAILERDGAEKYAQQIANDALAAGKARDRLAAIQEITDRVEGKPMQNIRHAGVFMVLAPSGEALAALDAWSEGE